MDCHKSMPARCRRGNRSEAFARSPAGRALACTAVTLLIWTATLRAAPGGGRADEHVHTALETSGELTWPVLIEATLEHYPYFVELAARDEEASALLNRARSWLSGQPGVAFRYQTDRPWDNADLREYELGIELPLWRVGERRAAASLGDAASAESHAAALALRHEIVGLLRTALWDIEAAVNVLAVARDGQRIAADLESVIERRYRAGELPLSETLLMRSTTLEREAIVIDAEAQLVDAERAYQSLTGLTARPIEITEAPTDRDDFDSTHPLLMLADASLERARADLELMRHAVKGTPALTIGPRREQAAFSDYAADSLGVSFSMPFGGRTHVTAEIAMAARAATRAEAERLGLLRRLDLDLHEARHGLLVIEDSLDLAQRRSELAATSFAMSRQAFAQGEMTLLELLRREETALLTQREVAGLEVERHRAIAQINQAIGVWP